LNETIIVVKFKFDL